MVPSFIACASGSFEVVKLPEQRSGRFEPPRQLADHHRADRRLRRAEGRRARAQRHGRQEVAEDDRRARPLQLGQRAAGHGLGQRLRDGAGIGHRPHGAAEDERHDHRRLVGAGIGAQRRRHGAVPDQRRVDVDVAEDDAVPVDEIVAEDDARHVDRILGPALGRHRAHEAAVGIFDVAVDHVEMALVDRHVDRLADRAAGMVQPGRGLRELHEVAEILDRAVAAALVEVHDEGRAVGRREDDALAADLDRLAPGCAHAG